MRANRVRRREGSLHTRLVTRGIDRFRDARRTKYDFIGAILVRCPNCTRVAHVVPAPEAVAARVTVFTPRRLVCQSCGPSRAWSGNQVMLSPSTVRPAADPYFGVPLCLQTETRHGWLWAYNLEHLNLLQRYVQATLREQASWYDSGRKMTLVARLPL